MKSKNPEHSIAGPQPPHSPFATTSPLIVVSVLNWNGWEDTIQCLASIRRFDYLNYLPVVVDNGSRNDSAERIKAWAQSNLGPEGAIADYGEAAARQGGDVPAENRINSAVSSERLVLVRNQENLGFSGGHNVAIRYALSRSPAADFVFLLNNDSFAPTDCLNQLLRVQQSAGAGIVGAVVTEKHNPRVRLEGPFSFQAAFFGPFIRDRADPGNRDTPFHSSDFVIGTAMLIKREVLSAIGASTGEYFPSELFFAGEEQLFCFAARQQNYPIVMAKNVVVEHLGGRSAGGRGSALMYYYGQRNSVLVARKVLPIPRRILFYALNLSLAAGRVGKNLWKRRYHAVWAVLHGGWDGYLGRVGKWKYHDREAGGSR